MKIQTFMQWAFNFPGESFHDFVFGQPFIPFRPDGSGNSAELEGQFGKPNLVQRIVFLGAKLLGVLVAACWMDALGGRLIRWAEHREFVISNGAEEVG